MEQAGYDTCEPVSDTDDSDSYPLTNDSRNPDGAKRSLRGLRDVSKVRAVRESYKPLMSNSIIIDNDGRTAPLSRLKAYTVREVACSAVCTTKNAVKQTKVCTQAQIFHV